MFDTILKVKYVLREEGIENFILRLARQLGLSSLEEYILYQRWGFDKDESDFEVTLLDIEPNEVVHTQQFPFDVRGANAIVGEGRGTWYRCVQRFDQYRLFEALRERFVEGKRWEEIAMYRQAIRSVRRGEKAWNGCRTPEEVEERCAFIDDLYEDIKESGYLSQEELRTASSNETEDYAVREVNGVTFPDELRVAIDPYGQLIRVAGGRHRLAIAKLLEVDEIPAVVQIVHETYRSRPDNP